MRHMIQAASRALIDNDPERLERLAIELSSRQHVVGNDFANVKRDAAVLSAQVEAAAAHIALRSRVLAAQETYEAVLWER